MTNNIKTFRLQAGVRAADISRRTGIPPNAISRFETGVARPSQHNASLIAQALGRQVREVFPSFDDLRDYPVVSFRKTFIGEAGQ